MLERLLKNLFVAAPKTLGDSDARLALTALLVRIARSDNEYARIEIIRIEQIIRHRYGLDPDQAQDLRREAELLEEAAPDTVRFTRAIKDAVPLEERIAVIEAAWSVVLIDGDRSDEEDALMRMVANLLGIGDRDSNIARQRAQ
ncbi:MAG: TerB family tellurite resistance protein, partial [Maritimibacter sp.]